MIKVINVFSFFPRFYYRKGFIDIALNENIFGSRNANIFIILIKYLVSNYFYFYVKFNNFLVNFLS